MEGLLVILFLGVSLAPLIAILYAVVRVRQLRRVVDELQIRVGLGEEAVTRLQERIGRSPKAGADVSSTPVVTPPTPQPLPDAIPERSPVPAPRPEPEPIPVVVHEAIGAIETPPTPVTVEDVASPESETPPDPVPDRPVAPAVGGLETWEARVGGSWLSRIGVAMLVLGIAFALGYTLTHLGPWASR